MIRSYLQPKSVTWWAGAGLIVTGLLRGLDAGFNLGGMADVIDAWSGSASPSVLILQGAGLIGLRGALTRGLGVP
jgi:hypothetical protein